MPGPMYPVQPVDVRPRASGPYPLRGLLVGLGVLLLVAVPVGFSFIIAVMTLSVHGGLGYGLLALAAMLLLLAMPVIAGLLAGRVFRPGLRAAAPQVTGVLTRT